MTARMSRRGLLLAGLAQGLLGSLAQASPDDIVLSGVRAPIRDITGVAGKSVVLYGPFTLTPALRAAKDAIYLCIDDVRYGGQIATAIFYVVDGSQKPGKPWRIDERHYVGSFATMQDGRTEPTQVVRSIHDYDVQGTPHRPLTDAQGMRSVMIAVVIERGEVSLGKLTVSPHPPGPREVSAPTAPGAKK